MMDVKETRDMDDRPCLVLAYLDSAFAVRWGRYFRRHGWSVHLAATAPEACRLVALLQPCAVIIDSELSDETGCLLAAELAHEYEDMDVFLVGAHRSESLSEEFSPRAWFSRQDDPKQALEAMNARRLLTV